MIESRAARNDAPDAERAAQNATMADAALYGPQNRGAGGNLEPGGGDVEGTVIERKRYHKIACRILI